MSCSSRCGNRIIQIIVYDGTCSGLGCYQIIHSKKYILGYQVSVTRIAVGLAAFLIVGSWLYRSYKKRKHLMLKKKSSQQKRGGTEKAARIFTVNELRQAANNYDESRIIGKGGFGTVYKGILDDDKLIAIAEVKSDCFNRRNVERLLGCCLEAEVALLVYEHISNGTLYEHIHESKNPALVLSWENRLRIATEVAGVLAYLHSEAAVPIVHRDFKSANVLLDESYTAKLTKQSDVYSFGVVLVELITGKKAISFARPEEERCLAMLFILSMKNDKLFSIQEAASLALACLKVKGDERPSMRKVASQLQELLLMGKHPWMDAATASEENEHLLECQILDEYDPSGSISSSPTASYNSITHHIVLSVGDGR
uniref:Protein kinase domain-containing protein n=1 Tax=Kalanchoe fedtschenkoi TaxID=63787 RepID=A0A7N0UB98_KALFE